MIYKHSDYDKLVDQTVETIRKLSTLKGGEYAGDVDRLANFRKNGEAWNLPMEQVWGVYAGKHWDAIQQYVKDLVSGKNRERLEGIESRADDLIVYLILFKAMWRERELYRQLEDSKLLECKGFTNDRPSTSSGGTSGSGSTIRADGNWHRAVSYTDQGSASGAKPRY